MHKASFAKNSQDWKHLAETVAQHFSGKPEVDARLARLHQGMGEAEEAKQRQVALRAAAQQATRDLETAMEKAADAAVELRNFLWMSYGMNSEKLIEFGLRPYPSSRGRKVRKRAAATGEDAQENSSAGRETRGAAGESAASVPADREPEP